STMYKKEYNQLKDEKEALTLRIETLEEEKNKADEDYDYIVLENMTLQSEIIGLERKIEELKKEHDEMVNSLYAELDYIIKKKR
ncbi:Atg14 domain-containing protein, partial [Klebsiella pneumoniae]|nr:Atg14 domain-containing protein [Klebsiella pneumoniae]